MRMFSNNLPEAVRLAESVGESLPIDSRGFLYLLEKASGNHMLDGEEIVELINGTRDPDNQQLILDFSASLRRPHDQEILLLPPLYFSSICENNCLYCDFSADGDRLSHEEFEGEVCELLEMGYRSIELVSSQDPDIYIKHEEYNLEKQHYRIDDVIRYFEIAAALIRACGGGMLTSNIPPLNTNSFIKLRKAGLDCYLIWLETFNPIQYSKLHDPKGPKISQLFRLDSFERAREAGIEHLAGAFLKGLYDWRKEEVVLYILDGYLKKKYGRGFSIIGTPRLKGRFLKSGIVRPYRVSDEEYKLNIALDRILIDGILWLQTRESFDFNRRLINLLGGGVILTLTSSTAPGGYRKAPRSRAQFPVYKQELSDAAALLEKDGYEVHFDWNSRTLASFIGKGTRTAPPLEEETGSSKI